MNVAVMKTKAEQALTEAFERNAPSLPGDEVVQQARAAAIGIFSAKGLPHRRVEEYKYTDLRAAIKEAYPLAGARGEVDAKTVNAALGPELSAIHAVRVTFVDGHFAEHLSQFDEGRDQTYYCDSLVRGLVSTTEFKWLKDRLADQQGAKSDALAVLNTAFAQDGIIMRIEDGAEPAKPFHLVFVSTGTAPAATFIRNMIGVGRSGKATVIESHVSLADAPAQNNVVTEIAVREGGRLDHAKVTGQGSAALHVSSAFVEVEARANYQAFQFTASNGLVRNQTFVTFSGEGGKIDLSGAFLARSNEHIDTTLVVDHAVPHCTSRELFKGVLDDRARGVFQGKIIVRPDAQKTDGKQMSQVLMLSPDAEFDSKPELEIYADDVVCGHGTTSAQIDGDLMFYCRSRGIPEAEARALMIESFIGEAFEKVEHEGLRNALQGRANAWLTHGAIKGR